MWTFSLRVDAKYVFISHIHIHPRNPPCGLLEDQSYSQTIPFGSTPLTYDREDFFYFHIISQWTSSYESKLFYKKYKTKIEVLGRHLPHSEQLKMVPPLCNSCILGKFSNKITADLRALGSQGDSFLTHIDLGYLILPDHQALVKGPRFLPYLYNRKIPNFMKSNISLPHY
jgi:hypothetical protein